MLKQPDPDLIIARNRARILPIDALRGLIIVFMALDHANYFVAQKHPPGEYWGGLVPEYPSALSFLTRLVTHFSAPGFFFLMGVGMMLFAHNRRDKGWGEWEIRRHFWARGALLILIQFTTANGTWSLGPQPFPLIYFGVLAALGGTMILSSLLTQVRPRVLLALTVVLLLGMEALHPDPQEWGLIFDQPLGLILGYSGGDMTFWVNYPVLAWLELVTLGMLFGHWLLEQEEPAYKRAGMMGIAFLGMFLLLRTADGFGNIRPRNGDTWIDYLYLIKYPPSLTFTFFTMGVNLGMLYLFSRLRGAAEQILKPLAVFGSAPLFFYVTHLSLYLVLGQLFTPEGTSIPAMLPFWLLGLLLLYPATMVYVKFKRRQSPKSVLRLL